MKKLLAISLLLIIMVTMVSCNTESEATKDIQVDIGQSNRFGEGEILEAIEAAKEGIVDYSESTFTKLWYDEEKTEQIYESQKQRYLEEDIDIDNFIVIMSEFETGDVEEGSPLNPNSTYEDYMWILKRDDSASEWVLFERGY